MLFLVISTPRPEKPTSMASTRHSYWDWMNPLLESGLAVSVHARVGRGAVALFDVDSTETLHRLMNEWVTLCLPIWMSTHCLIKTPPRSFYRHRWPNAFLAIFVRG